MLTSKSLSSEGHRLGSPCAGHSRATAHSGQDFWPRTHTCAFVQDNNLTYSCGAEQSYINDICLAAAAPAPSLLPPMGTTTPGSRTAAGGLPATNQTLPASNASLPDQMQYPGAHKSSQRRSLVSCMQMNQGLLARNACLPYQMQNLDSRPTHEGFDQALQATLALNAVPVRCPCQQFAKPD